MTREFLKKYQQTSYGTIAYLETGEASRPPVLFVHGIPTSGYLWRHVIRLLRNDFHCYAPDLMGLGDTEADPLKPLHMEAQAEMLAEFMSVLGHERFSVVCHDQGGAAVQILAVRFTERLRCLVMTDCVCYDNWPVPIIAKLQTLLRMRSLSWALTRVGAFAALEASPLSIFRHCVYDSSKMSRESALEYLRPLHGSNEEFDLFRRFFLAGSSRYTEQLIPELRKLETPTSIVWAADDRQISPSWGAKLYEDIPGARSFELVPFCGHFWQEEKPAEFAEKIGRFISLHGSQGQKESSGQV